MTRENFQREKPGGRAVVYRRTSTRHMTTKNTGSLEHQRRQREGLLQHGWPPEAIHVIDEDAGQSARPGVQEDGPEVKPLDASAN